MCSMDVEWRLKWIIQRKYRWWQRWTERPNRRFDRCENNRWTNQHLVWLTPCWSLLTESTSQEIGAIWSGLQPPLGLQNRGRFSVSRNLGIVWETRLEHYVEWEHECLILTRVCGRKRKIELHTGKRQSILYVVFSYTNAAGINVSWHLSSSRLDPTVFLDLPTQDQSSLQGILRRRLILKNDNTSIILHGRSATNYSNAKSVYTCHC